MEMFFDKVIEHNLIQREMWTLFLMINVCIHVKQERNMLNMCQINIEKEISQINSFFIGKH